MSANRPRVLFVDDERNVLEALRRALHPWQAQWDIVFHEHVAECLEEQRKLPFDVAVVDISMPVMTGLELIRALTAIDDRLLAIVLTGATDIATAAAAINEANVFRFYTKPAAAEILTQGIVQAIEEGRARAARRTSSARAAFSMAALDRLPTGVIVVDGDTKVMFTNKQGAQFLAGRDGLALNPVGQCRTNRIQETAELNRLVKAAIDSEARPHALSVSREESDRPLSVVVAPLPGGSAGEKAAVLLVGAPEMQPLPSVETVMRLFDLTDAEARLAVALTEGCRIEDAADRMGITVSSARTYLKRVFAKTDVDRQAELVRLILAAPVLLDLGAQPARARAS